VNICDSTRLIRRMLGGLVPVISETTYRGFRKFSQELPSLYALFCWALIVPIFLLMISGCGRYKEELESAKQQIEKLNFDVKRLTEESARLSQEKGRLTDDFNALSDKNARTQRELDELIKAKGALSAENKEFKKKYSSAEEEITSLKAEKAKLTQEVEELKKRAANMVPPPPPLAAMPTGVPPEKQLEELSPCDAVVAFMKASEGIIRQQKGTERTKLLEQIEQQYAPKMKGAPEKAIKAAKSWVQQGTKLWDKSDNNSSFRLLQLRNTVLEACGKSAGEAGF
jgi:uncharacterized protein YoxC